MAGMGSETGVAERGRGTGGAEAGAKLEGSRGRGA